MPQLVSGGLVLAGLRRSAESRNHWLGRSRVVAWECVQANDSALRLRQGDHFCVQALVKEFEVL